MRPRLIRGRIVSGGTVRKGELLIDGGRIHFPRGSLPEETEITDYGEFLILPSFIELHAHGGDGYDFVDMTREASDRIFALHLSHGVGRLCPTLCSCGAEKTAKFLDFCREISGHPCYGGAHLEGPFLSPEMCGAQNGSCLLTPTGEWAKRLSSYRDILVRVTMAPELDGTKEFAKKLTGAGILLSAGHTAADSMTLRRAVDYGFTSVTHLYCSTKKREKHGGRVLGGAEEEALINDNLTVELIGDGHHVSRENFFVTMRCKGTGRVAVVSDAMRGAGEDGISESWLGEKLPENRVIIEDGVAKLPDRSSFAGSLAVGDTMVRTLVKGYGISLPVVSEMMSLTPAKLLGISGSRGKLEEGYIADITVLDESLRTRSVYLSGRLMYVVNVL